MTAINKCTDTHSHTHSFFLRLLASGVAAQHVHRNRFRRHFGL